MVTIPFDNDALSSTLVDGQYVGQDLGSIILESIAANNKVTKKEIAVKAVVSEKTIEWEMKTIKNIEYVGSGYSGYRKIKDLN